MTEIDNSKQIRLCKVKDCKKKHKANGYCGKHYAQILRNGEISKRTIYDKNEYRFEGDSCFIFLYNKKCIKIAEVEIDRDCFDLVKNYKWSLSSNGYAFNGKKKILMHRLIMNPDDGISVDHINMNTLDCKKRNMRLCSSAENNMNTRLKNNNTSGFIGVIWDKDYKKFTARVAVNSKIVYRGYFDNKIDAAKARDEHVLIHHKEFAVTNKSLGLY